MFLIAVLILLSLLAPAAASAGALTGVRAARAGEKSIAVTWQSPRPRRSYRYQLFLRGRPVATTGRTSATLRGLECGTYYTIRVEAHHGKRRLRAVTVSAATAPCRTVNLAELCSGQNCDAAFASMAPGNQYYLPAGTWRFTKPLVIPSNVTLTGDGTGLTGTDLVYSGPATAGAIVIGGAEGQDWVNGHLAGVEIETDQLHQLRLKNDTAYATVPITQAATGLQIVNPTASSSVTNVNAWKFGRSSVQINNGAASPGGGVFQFSNFFVGTSPHPIEVRGSRARLLIRFGGIDLGPLSELGMLFSGDQEGAPSVVQSVKIEGDHDVPGYIVEGSAPVVFVGTTRYLNQSLYVDNPINGAPAFTDRGAGSALQCLACTALGEQTALALPGREQAVPSDKWGINLHRLTPAGARAVATALKTPETPVPRPTDVIDLSAQCVNHNCDAALANLKFAGRYYLPAGVWTFSRPFTVPETATFFGDGRQSAQDGGTTLRYVGPSVADAAVRWGAGNGDMSGRLFSLRIDTQKDLASGFGIRARDATNAATLEDFAVEGFPDGQLLLDATPADAGSGPNFVRVARFSLTGGKHPLQIDGGRQTVLIEDGDVQVDRSSKEGVNFIGGEQLAATRVVSGVTVSGNADVPGFRVRSPAVTAFVNSRRVADSRLSSPGFLYTAVVPRRVTECLDCSASGVGTAFSMPQLNVDLDASDRASFDYLNADSSAVVNRRPLNLDLPTVGGAARVGEAVAGAPGRWTGAPTEYTYQWIRCKRPDVPSSPATRCVAIDGENGPTHRVTPGDAGFYLRLSVTARNGSGITTATSLPTLASE
jgi:hypothetical protein